MDGKDKASMTSKTEDGKASTLINKNPAAFASRKSSNEDSLQLSLNDTQEKFRSLEVVKSLHKEGDHVKDKHSEGELGQLYTREQSVQRAANSSNLLINSDGEEDTSHRQSTELENLRYLSFARKDSENSIIQIQHYGLYDKAVEPHVQSSGSIILKQPSLQSIHRQQSKASFGKDQQA